MPRRSSRQTRPLTREAVLRAAIALADEGGSEALSMRRLAHELGIEAMSLYHHVRDKDDLLDGMVDLVVSEIELPSGPTWKAALRKTAMSARTVLDKHAWAPGVMQARSTGPARLAYMEALLRTLRDAGLSPEMTDHAYHAIESHIIGFTLWTASFKFSERDLTKLATEFVSHLSAGDYPRLIEHVDQHKKPRRAGIDFEFGLDLILDGLEKYRRAPTQRAR